MQSQMKKYENLIINFRKGFFSYYRKRMNGFSLNLFETVKLLKLKIQSAEFSFISKEYVFTQ